MNDTKEERIKVLEIERDLLNGKIIKKFLTRFRSLYKRMLIFVLAKMHKKYRGKEKRNVSVIRFCVFY